MLPRLTIAYLICSALLCARCTNELDVTTTYKDTTIVYALLSPTDSIQYVKIYKAFLGDGNAFEFAQHPDSFYFTDILNVQLLRNQSGLPGDTIKLKRDTILPMNDGIFASAPNVAYTTGEPIDMHSAYQLQIYNQKSGSMVTASTLIPDVAKLSQPSPQSDEISLASAPQYTINWLSGVHAKIYSVVMRFYYEEITAGISTPLYIDWFLGNKLVKNHGVPEYLDLVKSKEGFYKNLESGLSIPDSQTYRLAGKVELIFTAGAEDYYYYQHINNISVGVSQSIPSFTNVRNGIGIFSARNISKWSFDLDPPSYDYLRNGPYTSHLKFY